MSRKGCTIIAPALKTWDALNEKLRHCQEKVAEQLLAEERQGRARKQFLLRIHSRLNYLRAERERRQLLKERHANS